MNNTHKSERNQEKHKQIRNRGNIIQTSLFLYYKYISIFS